MKGIKQEHIIPFSIGIILTMILVFPVLTEVLGKTKGYFISYGIYLVILSCGIFLFRAHWKESVTIKSKSRYLYYVAAFVPVLATFYVAFLPTVSNLSAKILCLIAIYAIFNGVLEEFFWRYSFNRIFPKNIVYAYILPTIIFSCWHFALLFARGISYHGGALALVGGAAFMGVIWGLAMYKTQNVKVVIVAHVLVNFFAFSQLISQNWFT